MTGWRRWVAAVVGLALAGTIAGAAPASAQQSSAEVQVQAQAPPPPPPAAARGRRRLRPRRSRPRCRRRDRRRRRRRSPRKRGRTRAASDCSLGVDWASAYYFRGIVNEQNGGNNVQPYGEIGFRLLENMGPLTSLVVGAGIWNNWHYGGGTLVEPSDPKFWFEADIYVKLSRDLVGGLDHRRHLHLLHEPQRQLHVVRRRRALRAT